MLLVPAGRGAAATLLSTPWCDTLQAGHGDAMRLPRGGCYVALAVSAEAAKIAGAQGLIDAEAASLNQYALGLRFSVAISVGLAILVGVLRILRGWPVHYLIIGGYAMVMLMTIVAPKEIVGIAYDAGGVTTSTVTVPLVAALGVGLASIIRGRSPLLDGFGLIAFASLLPMIFVMGYGLIVFR